MRFGQGPLALRSRALPMTLTNRTLGMIGWIRRKKNFQAGMRAFAVSAYYQKKVWVSQRYKGEPLPEFDPDVRPSISEIMARRKYEGRLIAPIAASMPSRIFRRTVSHYLSQFLPFLTFYHLFLPVSGPISTSSQCIFQSLSISRFFHSTNLRRAD